ncbi:hypothetical protein FCJ61_06040 [Burkholderia metallica]|uniref:hypothetical protein n=1 Tax=Burkholderia metallica TaxID=488729 RepID=UPI00157A3394|nr:hypothetical protein [Burkholderia metallica]NTZ82573.1 hypothetical protein [Burkholderia metallica]
MQVCVKLPADPLIDYLGLCKSIAQALHPADEKDIAGLDCITGKIVTHHVPMEPAARTGLWPNEAAMQSVLISDDGHTLDQLAVDPAPANVSATPGLDFAEPVRVQVVELSLPYALTDDDRRALEKLLPQLPALRYPMSDEDAAAFMDAYFRLKSRPAWEPTLVSARTIERRKFDQDAAMRHHQQALQEEFAKGRLVSVDSRYVPTVVLAAGCYIPREQVIAYLARIGIGYHDQDTADERGVQPAGEPEAAPESPVAPVEVKSKVGNRKLTDEQRRAVVEFFDELTLIKGVKNPNMQTAERFNISDRYVRALVGAARAAEAEAALAAAEAEKESRIDYLLASGKK